MLEPKGRTEVGRHMAYVLNVRENYGLTEGEIGESRSALALKGNPCSARDILERAFQQKVSIYTMAGEWSKLRNLYYVMANFHLRAEAGDKALSCLFLVFFLDMSGMGNRNTVIPYENLFPTQKGMILLLDEVRHRENMTAEEVKAAFLSSVARMAPRLPFSYFSPQVMAAQLLERLRGVPFNGAKYIAERNVPDPSAGAYHYVPWGREEAGSLKEVPKFTVPKSWRRPACVCRPLLRGPSLLNRQKRGSGGKKWKTGGPHCRASNAGGEKGKRSACEIEKMDIGETMENGSVSAVTARKAPIPMRPWNGTSVSGSGKKYISPSLKM